MAVIQNSFNAQLPQDREALAAAAEPASKPRVDDPSGADPGFVPMVRITLAVPEDLRYRLKMVLMDHQRKSRARMTQDEFCAKAIGAHLDQEEGRAGAGDRGKELATFLGTCMQEGALAAAWIPRAKALLEGNR